MLVIGAAVSSVHSNPCQGLPDSLVINYPHPSDCSQFIKCIGSAPLERQCPIGQHFNAALGACSSIETANCSPAAGPQLPNPQCDLNTNFEIIANPQCTSYTICACGHAHVRQCAAGSIFDAATGQCMVGGVCVSDPSLSPTCPNGFVGFLPHPTDCNHHFLCAGAAPILRRCAPGMRFSAATRQCEIAATVSCPARSMSYSSVHNYSQMMTSGRPHQSPIVRPSAPEFDVEEFVADVIAAEVEGSLEQPLEELTFQLYDMP